MDSWLDGLYGWMDGWMSPPPLSLLTQTLLATLTLIYDIHIYSSSNTLPLYPLLLTLTINTYLSFFTLPNSLTETEGRCARRGEREGLRVGEERR